MVSFVVENHKSVPVKIIGGEGKPEGKVEIKELPKHKKNEEIGLKKTYYGETIYVEQADAITFGQDEEVRAFSSLFFSSPYWIFSFFFLLLSSDAG